MANGSVTLSDVANVANVSKSTASRILGANPRKKVPFSSETRQRVCDAAARLGYRPSKLARGLSSSKTGIIGLVIPSLIDSFFPEVATAVETYLAERGYSVILANTNAHSETERRKVEDLLSWHVDGLIVAPAQEMGVVGQFWELWRNKVPFVLIDRVFPQTPFGSVTTQDDAGAVLAVEHLLGLGRQRIARAGDALDISTCRLRHTGYTTALMRHGIMPSPDYALEVPSSEEGGRIAVRKILAMTPRPDALFCFSDYIAIGVLDACRAEGVRVPDDLAVVGFADLPHSGLLKVGLTTVRQPCKELGRRAAEMLIDCMEKKCEPVQVALPVELVVRESTVGSNAATDGQAMLGRQLNCDPNNSAAEGRQQGRLP
jgi:LacI family transcriptional regulator